MLFAWTKLIHPCFKNQDICIAMFFKIKSNCSNIFLALASLLQISFIINSEYVLQVNSATALQEVEENTGKLFWCSFYCCFGLLMIKKNNLDYYWISNFLRIRYLTFQKNLRCKDTWLYFGCLHFCIIINAHFLKIALHFLHMFISNPEKCRHMATTFYFDRG